MITVRVRALVNFSTVCFGQVKNVLKFSKDVSFFNRILSAPICFTMGGGVKRDGKP